MNLQVNRTDTDWLKGVAMVFVLIAHLVPPLPVVSPLIGPVKAYLGQVGVNLFMFLSGYGIARTYLCRPEARPSDFIRRRLTAVWPIYIFAISVYALLQVGVYKEPVSFGDYVVHLAGLQTYFGIEDRIYWPSYFMTALLVSYVASWVALQARSVERRLVAAGLVILLLGLTHRVLLGRFYFLDLMASFAAGIVAGEWGRDKRNTLASLSVLACLTLVPLDIYRLATYLGTMGFLLLMGLVRPADGLTLRWRPADRLLVGLGQYAFIVYLGHHFIVWKYRPALSSGGDVVLAGSVVIVTLAWVLLLAGVEYGIKRVCPRQSGPA